MHTAQSSINNNVLFFNIYVFLSFQILGIVCLAFASPARLSGTNWFLFVVIISFIATAIWSFVYLLSIREAINFPINWVLTVLILYHYTYTYNNNILLHGQRQTKNTQIYSFQTMHLKIPIKDP